MAGTFFPTAGCGSFAIATTERAGTAEDQKRGSEKSAKAGGVGGCPPVMPVNSRSRLKLKLMSPWL